MNKYKKYFDSLSKVKKNKKKTSLKKVLKKYKRLATFKSLKNLSVQKSSIFSSVSFSIKDQTFFAKRLSFLIKSGVPMLESIHLITKQTKSKNKIKVFDRIISDVANGQSLATSLGRFRKMFGGFAINIIKAGESSGTLTENLSYLADELKKKEMLRKKIMSAMLYPIIITVATFGITGFLALYIFPKIIPIFNGLKAKLPLSTRIVMYITELIRHSGVYLFLGFTIIIVGVVMWIKKSPKARFTYHGLLLRIPFVGNIAKNYNLTNSCRTFGLLLKSGMSLNEALLITADTTENVQYKKAFTSLSTGVIRGKNISELVEQYPTLFPPMIGHMVAIGEKSGNLSNTLIYLSEFYENEFEDVTKNLSSAIEPVLMIVMGVLVGFIAISIITPIYSITQNLHA